MVDTDGHESEQVDTIQRIGGAVHLLFQEIDPTLFPLLEKGSVKLRDTHEMRVEAPCGHAEPGTEVRHRQGVHAAFGEEVERDNEHFRNAPRPLLVPFAVEENAQANGGPPLRTLIHMDDPEHKAFRGITASWFLPGHATLRKKWRSASLCT